MDQAIKQAMLRGDMAAVDAHINSLINENNRLYTMLVEQAQVQERLIENLKRTVGL